MNCRFCNHILTQSFVDLGTSPLCQSTVTTANFNTGEIFYPLHAFVCDKCFLVQLDEFVSPSEIFEEYAYFSSYSDSWLEHAKLYAEKMIDELRLGEKSLVVEAASNDGYLLQYFAQRNIPVLGIEPAKNVAVVAAEKGIETRPIFLSKSSAQALQNEGIEADLLVGNNVLAQVPDLNGFVEGLKLILGQRGVLTIEFPHLLRLMERNQFDTIYHEHYSYFSLSAAARIFSNHGLVVYSVEELETHGGSLRVFLRHLDNTSLLVQESVAGLLELEREEGLLDMKTYSGFARNVRATKRKLLSFLTTVKEDGKSVAGYGAPGKGNTLLNYCGIRTDFIDYTVDRNPYKQGTYLPGTRIPVFAPEKIKETRPDYVFILPWNLKSEIIEQLDYIRSWGGQFIVPIPEVQVIP